jgi:hypothetical protein
MASLDSVKQKIFRAILHGKTLEPELMGYFETNPGHMVRDQDSSLDRPTFTFHPKGPVPARFGLIVGDCFQNLRSSLDYLVWELVLAENNQPTERNMFPVCSTPDAFKDALDKRKRLLGIHPEASALIESLQPYHLGKNWQKSILWIVDEFTNINKHRRVLLTMLRASRTPIEVVDINGELWGHGRLPIFDGDAKIGPLVSGASAEMQMDAQLIACVTFDEGPTKGMEITGCTGECLNYIEKGVIPKFERFFH